MKCMCDEEVLPIQFITQNIDSLNRLMFILAYCLHIQVETVSCLDWKRVHSSNFMQCCLHISLALWELRFPWLWKFKLLSFGLQGHVASPLRVYRHFKATYCLHFWVGNMCQLKNFFTNTTVLWMCNNVKHLECWTFMWPCIVINFL
jgi:hypothetical protein